MLKKISVIFAFFMISLPALSQEYCIDKYNDQISKANLELGNITKRQSFIDRRITEIVIRNSKIAEEMASAAQQTPPDVNSIKKLSSELNSNNQEKSSLEVEGFRNIDRAQILKVNIPAELQGQLRGCVDATAPTNKFVNLAIQTLALLSTGGASLALPPKSLYVDMSAVLNGYPTGGSSSVINQARESALNSLGIGGENNTLGKVVRDPVNQILCGFRC